MAIACLVSLKFLVDRVGYKVLGIKLTYRFHKPQALPSVLGIYISAKTRDQVITITNK